MVSMTWRRWQSGTQAGMMVIDVLVLHPDPGPRGLDPGSAVAATPWLQWPSVAESLRRDSAKQTREDVSGSLFLMWGVSWMLFSKSNN
jgi:hypothetical protein